MNIIIVGCGKVGATLVMTLSKENNNISVIDTDPDVVDQIAGVADIIGVVGNGASLNVQKEAGIKQAEVLIATTDLPW